MHIGIDPGKSGAIVALRADGTPIGHIKNTSTDRELWVWLCDVLDSNEDEPVRATIERVHAMPGQGVSSTFKFGASYGGLLMLLACAGVPFDEVTPAKWQGALGCRSKGDKNVTKRRAQELFPGVRMTHAIADAYLIAEYCRRSRLGLL